MSGCMETPGSEMGEAALITKYVSCIRIYGQPILPPVMTAVRREEMRLYRAKAEQVDKKLRYTVESWKSDNHTDDVTEVIERIETVKASSSFKKVNTHEILEEFDPFAPTVCCESEPGAKCRHSGSSDEFFVSKTDSSNNSVAMTNSTDLYHYMDVSGSTLGDGRSSSRSLTAASTRGTTAAGDWSSTGAELSNDADKFNTTYEGLNEYLDSILNSSTSDPNWTERGHHDEETTPTNGNANASFADFQEQLNRREANRPASCPLSPTPQQSPSEGRARGSCAEGKLIDLANEPSAYEGKGGEAFAPSNTVPRLVRSNSYTLESPSPMLLAHLEAEKRKKQTTKVFSNIKQPMKNVVAAFKNKSHVEKPKNGVVASRKNEGQARKDNVTVKPLICHSPPAKRTLGSPVVTGSPSTALSPKSNRNRLTPTATSPAKAVPQKDCANHVNVVASEQVRKLLTNLQAEHNRQMEELLARQRKEQELIRQAILRQKDLLISDPSLLATQLSDAGSGGNYTWASLLKGSDDKCNTNREASNADQSLDCTERGTAPRLLQDNHGPHKELEPEPEPSRKIVCVVNQTPTSRSASDELIQIHKEALSVSRSMSANFVLSHLSNKEPNNDPPDHLELELASFNSNTFHRAASMSETCIDLLHPERNRNLDSSFDSNGSNTNHSSPKSPTENFSVAFNSACEETAEAIHQLQRRNALDTFLAADVTVGCLSSKETLPNPFRDANGNLSQTSDLNSKNLLVSLDANDPAVNPSTAPAIHQEDGVLTCYEEILSTEVYPAVTSEREQSQIGVPTAEISPRGRRKAWDNRQTALQGTSLKLGDPQWLEFSRQTRKHWAASKIQAAARGYLTRRLLRTERVQNCITVIHDTILCALELQKECGRNVEPSDLQLHGRLIHQLSDACREIHSIFVELPVGKRMAIICVDRERLQSRTPRSLKSNMPRPLSRATQIALNRKMINCQSNSVIPETSGRRRSWANLDWPRSSRPASSTFLPEANETIPSSPAIQLQKSASTGSTRKPWR